MPIVPHMDWGDENCCGCLIVRERGDQAEIACNECGAVIRTVPVEFAPCVMLEVASGVICSVRYAHCDALNTFPGFSAIEAFICAECGESVPVSRPVQ